MHNSLKLRCRLRGVVVEYEEFLEYEAEDALAGVLLIGEDAAGSIHLGNFRAFGLESVPVSDFSY